MPSWVPLPLLLSTSMALIAGVVWLVRLEGKIALTDQQNQAILDRLERIERLLDRLLVLNGHH